MQKYLRSLVLLVIAVCYSGFAPAAGIINFPIDTVRDEIESSNVTIKYNESFSSVPKSEKIVRPMLLRNQRLSPHTATIRTVAENVPTEVLTCINYARSIWENMLSSDVSLVVNVNYESIENDIEDFKKGFFIANLDRECSTKLEVTTYNKNGQTTSDAIYIPALGYPEEISDLSYNVSNGKLMINGIPNALIKNGKIHYTITSALNPAANYNGVLADDRQVDISGLLDGFYVISIYSNNRMIGSGKFVK